MKNGKLINWAELPSDLISSILVRLSVAERLQNAGNVCRSWRRACQEPSIWLRIDVSRFPRNIDEAMCRRAVDLSQGGLLEINIEDFGTDSLLTYIADRSRNLKRLGLVNVNQITGMGISKAAMKLPLLEYLEVTNPYTEELDLRGLGLSCPNLKTLKLNNMGCVFNLSNECDDDALAIAETMPGLRHLQLTKNRLSNAGVNAILENCPRLERFDLHRCIFVNLVPASAESNVMRGSKVF
ncbi:hypothetical protein EUTSA_v10027905mg [Eutrema salsugineum]|uniref:F-box domain-containing protein n=1 Tax=Eutrema salsugineum TaxID=72664 RepID=V4LT86_EUTSA|nr:putative F-box/LRR-repeat protein 9 [Eutrema salsugineum]ESQ46999.1 hypothetical protein EUTSA_v10027905mg [Eutrema salsugineum]